VALLLNQPPNTPVGILLVFSSRDGSDGLHYMPNENAAKMPPVMRTLALIRIFPTSQPEVVFANRPHESAGSAKIPEALIPVSIPKSILTPKNYLFILLFNLYKNILIRNPFNF
jgi:hypothetical protein